MKTDELIQLLATDAAPVIRRPQGLRYARALALALPFSLLLMGVLLGVRADLDQAVHLPMFWIKLAFPTLLAAVGLILVQRVSVPGRTLGYWPATLALPVLAMWLLAAWRFQNTTDASDLQLVLGQTWRACPWLIMLLSVPLFAAVFATLRAQAPTRLTQAGAVAGLLSGSVGAMVYCLHCPEMEPAFLGTWYLLGIVLTSLIGAALGRSWLRW